MKPAGFTLKSLCSDKEKIESLRQQLAAANELIRAYRAESEKSQQQLAEAYEAGKRDASEDLEQAAFEKWLYDKCPSGDVESVQRQWLKSYEYAEFAGKLEQAAQIEMMREALTLIALDDCCTDPVPIAQEALAIQPDDNALKAWLGKQSSRVKGVK